MHEFSQLYCQVVRPLPALHATLHRPIESKTWRPDKDSRPIGQRWWWPRQRRSSRRNARCISLQSVSVLFCHVELTWLTAGQRARRYFWTAATSSAVDYSVAHRSQQSNWQRRSARRLTASALCTISNIWQIAYDGHWAWTWGGVAPYSAECKLHMCVLRIAAAPEAK